MFKSRSHLPPSNVRLVSPENGRPIGVYEEFKWRYVPSAVSYTLDIRVNRNSSTIVHATTQQNYYVLTEDDHKSLRDHETYTWFITAALASGQLSSAERSFTFVRPQITSEFSNYSESQRKEIESTVTTTDAPGLERLNRELGHFVDEQGGKRTSDVAWALQTRGIVLKFQGKRDEALKSYAEASAIWEELGVPDPLLYARCLTNFGSTLQDADLFDKSLAAYKRALAILRSRDEKSYLIKRSTCLLNLGVLYRTLGLARQAERSYVEALSIDRSLGDLDSVADELTNQANLIVSEFDEPKRGIPLLEEAMYLQREAQKRDGEPRPTMADTLDSMAVAYSAEGRQAEAVSLWDEALKIDQGRGNTSGMLASLNNVANMFLDDLKDHREALHRYQTALDIISNNADVEPDQIWRTYDGLSRLYQSLGEVDTAEGYSQKAIQIVTNMRKTLGDRQYRRAFNAFHTGPFYGMALLRVHQHKLDAAFDVIESAKASALSESEVDTSNQMDLTVLMRTLKPDEMVLEYVFGTKPDAGLLLAIDQQEARSYELSTRRSLEPQIREVIYSISRDGDSETTRSRVAKLCTQLIPPDLSQRILQRGIKHLIVSPDGLLHNLPFESLIWERPEAPHDYFIHQYLISVVPSLRWWHKMNTNADLPSRSKDLLVVANPVIDATGCASPPGIMEEIMTSGSGGLLPPLPYSQQESDTAMWYASRNSTALSGPNSRADLFIQQTPENFKIIHFATHALSGQTLGMSLLLFGCAERTDALTGSQILDLKLNQQLVILSACETDVGDTLFGEGNDSLASSFLLSGAASVVATRWRLRDDVPPKIMEIFYDQLSRGESVEKALRTAKISYASSDRDPRNWAAFTVLGNGAMKLAIEPRRIERMSRFLRNNIYLIVILLAAVMVLTLVIVKHSRRSQLRSDHREL